MVQKISAAQLLLEEFERRKRNKPQYSLRMFSQELGINSGTLSRVLSGQRALPMSALRGVFTTMHLNPEQKQIIFEGLSPSVQRKLISQGDWNPLESKELLQQQRHFNILAQWEHYAVLSLMQTKGFKSDSQWIARRLGVSPAIIENVVKRLFLVGLIKKDKNDNWFRTENSLEVSEEVVDAALTHARTEEARLAEEKFKSVAKQRMDYSSMILPIDASQMGELKELIVKFQNNVEALARKGEPNEVYNLCVQLFPLTKSKDYHK